MTAAELIAALELVPPDTVVAVRYETHATSEHLEVEIAAAVGERPPFWIVTP